MEYIKYYHSPLGELLLSSDGDSLSGCWFCGQKYYPENLEQQAQEKDLSIFRESCDWLNRYFAGVDPGRIPPVKMAGSDFQQMIWELLQDIPYGQTTTYGTLAREVAGRMGRSSMSAQAVGNAVGRNPISIFIPCHRVLGQDGSLTGYAGGLDRKKGLLSIEGSTEK